MASMKYLALFFMTWTSYSLVTAQELLTVQDAVELTLANNYDIKLSENNRQVAVENVTYGNAGMLPLVSGNFTQSNSIQNSKQTQNDGNIRELDNAKNNNMSYGVSLGWTIFDGLGMFSRYESLKELEKLSSVEAKGTLVTMVSDVIRTYYSIVEQQNLLVALDSSILISKERLRTAENRFSIGKASRLEVLNVQVNLNEDESARLRQLDLVNNLKTALNGLMARPLLTEFNVIKDVNIDQSMVLTDLLSKAAIHNPDLLRVGINKRLAELELKTIKANRYPTVRLNGGYNFSESESSLGFVARSNSRGLNYGVTASVNIFDGFNQRRNERVAKLKIDNADLAIEQRRNVIETALTQAFQSYQTSLALVHIEEGNERIAKQNLNITMDKYRIGTISAVEFRDAQQNFINAVSRFNTAKTQAKLSESLLKELVGTIDFL
ncbi:outer membrane protein TolC [Sphingobacterium yanglingense]|uniref:Outer membrane protein TolC n=2 Tax=Sphingobacterium yanglingense TaxID=1437280 RepID=A0A4R6WR52_9SPHI|nr:outer membrane protein TolC [Sphingobacterium yanglingense]